MPKSPDAVTWPSPPASADMEWTDEVLDMVIDGGYMLCGNPEEVAEQLVAYQSVGCDQVSFGLPVEGMQHDEIEEMIELFGDQVIPEFDSDPVHSTTRFRENAVRRYPDFEGEIPDGIDVSLIPDTAILPLGS